MAHEKQFTAKQAAFAVLEKVGELLKKSELLKAEQPGKIAPKQKEQAPPDSVQTQVAPQQNPKEQAEGNNMLAGTTPTQVGPDQKNLPGFDEMRGHIKLAKFLGHMEHKRISKKVVM